MPQNAVVVLSNIPEGATGQAVLLSLAQILSKVEAETSEAMHPTTVFVQQELEPGTAIVLKGPNGEETALISNPKPRR